MAQQTGEAPPHVASTLLTHCRLLRAAKEVEKNETKKYESTVHAIQNDHIEASKRWVSSPVIRGKLLQDLETICTELILFLGAVERVGEVSPRTLDTIISTGEILSCRIMVAILQDRGVDSTLVDLSHASKNFPCSHGLNQDFYTHLTSVLSSKVKQCGNSVPVVTGFFGTITGGLMNKIGRGYTDLCAALIAVGLGAEVLQVWKEVDGIFTANPHKVPTARLLPTISPAESAELTFLGSEVIHPFTMEQVIRARIPIRIRNVMNLRNQGTIIVPEPLPERPRSTSSNGSSSKLFRSRHSWQVQSGLRPKRPTAITVKPSILVLNVHSNKRSLSHGFFANIFSVLDKWRLSVDLISTSEVHVSMALHSESVMVSGEDDKEILDADLRGAVEELAEFGTVDLMDSMAILSLVGKQMKNMPGIAGKMFSVLGENNVNIEMISQGEPKFRREQLMAGRC